MRKGMQQLCLATAALSLVGCVARLCPEDRALLNQAIEASRTNAAFCARQAEQAAGPTEPAPPAGQPQAAAQPAAAGESRVEEAVIRAEAAAQRAEQAAEMTRKMFESGLRK